MEYVYTFNLKANVQNSTNRFLCIYSYNCTYNSKCRLPNSFFVIAVVILFTFPHYDAKIIILNTNLQIYEYGI